MSTRISGTVSNTHTKEKISRAGKPFKVHYVDVTSDTGESYTINVGFKNPFEDGQSVTVPIKEAYGEWQMDKDSAPSMGPGKPASPKRAPSSAPSRSVSPTSNTFPIDPSSREVSIVRQSSLNRAIETARLLYETGALEATEDALRDKIMELAYEYTDFCTGKRESDLASAISAGKTIAPTNDE